MTIFKDSLTDKPYKMKLNAKNPATLGRVLKLEIINCFS